MKNLNLSNDAAQFISTLDKSQAQIVWTGLFQLSQLDDNRKLGVFGEGKLFTIINEFIIIVKPERETLYVNTIGRRSDALVEEVVSGPEKAPKPTAKQLDLSQFNFDNLELFALSFAFLFFSLTIERWFLHDFSVFGALASFPMLVCFTGAAIGVLYKGERLFNFMPIFFLACVLVALGFKHVDLSASAFLSQAVWQYLDHLSIPGAAITIGSILVLLTAPFGFAAACTSRIRKLFSQYPPLDAYGTVLLAALFGYLTFRLTCLFCWAPLYQVTATSVVLLIFANREIRPRLPFYACLCLAVLAMLMPLGGKNGTSFWTPYHQVVISANSRGADAAVVSVTDGTLQEAVFTSDSQSKNGPANAAGYSASDLTSLRDFYRLPFTLKRPKTLLVLNSGIGSSVQEALGQNIDSIDAVELDPSLLKLGKKFNPAYQSPAVHIHCQDPRNFVDNCQSRYDMIISACENFIVPIGFGSIGQNQYQRTQEFYRKCLTLLNADGIVLYSFAGPSYTGSDWLRDRFYVTAKEASGGTPLVVSRQNQSDGFSPYLFAVAKDARAFSPNFDSALNQYTLVKIPANLEAKVATDDWPYIYFNYGAIEILYLACSAALIGTVSWLGQASLFSKVNSPANWQVFFLNTGLVTMILGSMPRLVLMCGSSWLTVTTIFSGMLIFAWLAQRSIRKSSTAQYELILYVGLIASLILSYFLPVRWLSSFGVVGNLFILSLTVLPMFRVLLMLPAIFSEAQETESPLAFSLLGLAGGLWLSHATLYVGQNNLLLIALILFGFSVFLCVKGQKALIPPVAQLATKRIT